eukprot:12912873-Prorocentrum_lima.AAC.1
MLRPTTNSSSSNLHNKLASSWRAFLNIMLKHCENVVAPDLLSPGCYCDLQESLSVKGMLQENFGLLSCFLPEE